VQQEVRAGVAVQSVDDLLILAGAQGGHNQALGFAAGEQGRPVGARQKAGFAHNRAHGLVVTPVNARATVDDIAAQDRGFQLFDG